MDRAIPDALDTSLGAFHGSVASTALTQTFNEAQLSRMNDAACTATSSLNEIQGVSAVVDCGARNYFLGFPFGKYVIL